MDDEAKFYLSLMAGLLGTIALLILGCTFLNFWHMHRMAELGYEQRMVTGHDGPIWQKLPQPVRVECDCPKVTPMPLVTITNYLSDAIYTTNRFDILEDYVRETRQRVLEVTNYLPLGSNVTVDSNGWLELNDG